MYKIPHISVYSNSIISKPFQIVLIKPSSVKFPNFPVDFILRPRGNGAEMYRRAIHCAVFPRQIRKR